MESEILKNASTNQWKFVKKLRPHIFYENSLYENECLEKYMLIQEFTEELVHSNDPYFQEKFYNFIKCSHFLHKNYSKIFSIKKVSTGNEVQWRIYSEFHNLTLFNLIKMNKLSEDICKVIFSQILEVHCKLFEHKINFFPLKTEDFMVDNDKNIIVKSLSLQNSLIMLNFEKYETELTLNCHIQNLGILIFSMLLGNLPFTHKNLFDPFYKMIYENNYDKFWSIIEKNSKKTFSSIIKLFIWKLLSHNLLFDSIDEIWKEPWLWDGYCEKEYCVLKKFSDKE
jgi:hypothetical protein